jgi:uncharacterized LabA/DUF88 family protein
MDRTGVFVDAGYLFAQGSEALAGKKLRRSETLLDQEKVLAFLEALAFKLTKLPLLRIYWYDGTDSGPTSVHLGLASRHNLKIRLGLVNTFGQQKGVDSLIVSDLINLSRNGAMADAVLLTGDEDIRVGVQQAQEVGVRVHLVGIEGARNSQSYLLKQEADTVCELSKVDVQAFLSVVQSAAPAPGTASAVAAPTGTIDPMQIAAEQFAATLGKSDLERVAKEPAGRVPPDIDRQLLVATSTGSSLTEPLTEPQKRQLRNAFVRACQARL